MPLAVLLWAKEQLRVITSTTECGLKLQIPAAERYWLKLVCARDGRVYLNAETGRHPIWSSDDGAASFAPVEAVPGPGAPIPGHRCKVHRLRGVLTALEQDCLWVWDSGKGWRARELPSGMAVRDTSFDRQGGLWCAGAMPSKRIPGEETEAALRYQPREGNTFEARSPRLRPVVAAKLIAQGGLAELRTIDAESDPLLATSICSWFLEDDSSFLYILAKPRTRVTRLKAETVRHIDRLGPGSVRVFTAQGGVWQASAGEPRRSSIAGALGRVLHRSTSDILIRGMDASADRIAVAVEVAPPGATGFAQDPQCTAVCLSLDGGKSFELLHRFDADQGFEAWDVGLLAE